MAGKQEVLLTFAGDAKQLKGTFNEVGASAGKFGKESESSFKKANKVAVGASVAIMGAAAGIGKSLVDAGREGMKQDRALEQVFTSMGGQGSAAFKQVGDAQKDMSKRLGETATDVASVQTKLGTFGKVWDDPIKGAENFNRASELAFDLEAAGFGEAEGNAVQLGKALQEPTKGMSALARSGVSFTDAEKEKIKKLEESGDLLGAQEMIYKALEGQVGGVAEATTDGGERMNAAWENFQDTLGRKLIPAFEGLMSIGQDVLVWAEENKGLVLGVGAAVVGLAGSVLVANAAWKVYLATTRAITLATKAWAVAQRVLNVVMKMNPIGLIITAVAGLVAGIMLLWNKSSAFRDFFIGAWNKIKGAVVGVWNWIKGNWKNLLTILTGPIGIAVRLITSNWDKIKNGASRVIAAVKRIFSNIGNAIAAPFRAGFNMVRNAWNSTVGGKGFDIPGWVPVVGGKSFRIPYFHTGGVMGGAPGTEGLAMLQSGERVTPAGSSKGQTVTLRSDGSAFSDLIMQTLRNAVRDQGGNVQFVLGAS